MKENKATLLAVVICEVIIIPVCYFMISKSILVTLVAAIVVAALIVMYMRKAQGVAVSMEKVFREAYPEETITYCHLADIYKSEGGTSSVVLIVTENAIFVIILEQDGPIVHKLAWDEIESYSCGAVLELKLKENDMNLAFNIYDSKVLDELLGKHIPREK